MTIKRIIEQIPCMQAGRYLERTDLKYFRLGIYVNLVAEDNVLVDLIRRLIANESVNLAGTYIVCDRFYI